MIACEFSGRVREAFRARGHDALSCDLLPSEIEGPHYQGNVQDILSDGWDLMIAHPPCTYLCVSGLHWNKKYKWRDQQTEEALRFVELLLNAPISRIAIENPVGIISTRIRPPDQVIQPYNFGEDASKQTCLWLKNLPVLRGTEYVPPSVITWDGKKRWGNQGYDGREKSPPSEDRWKNRSRTYIGIAQAMADQWG